MQTIYLDVSNRGAMPRIYAKQSDIGKKFVAVVTDGGVPFEIPDNALISIWYDGASGSGNYTKIDKESAVFVSQNRISVELIQQMLSVPGDGTITIVINSEDGKQIGLWNIQYDVERVAGWDSEGAKDYFSAFSNATENLVEASRLFLTDETLTKQGRPADAYESGLRISALEGRMDEFSSLPDGSTTGDAELADARVGYNGKSYENVGAHIRDIGKLAHNTSFAAENLVGNIPILVSRQKDSDCGLARRYTTEMKLIGDAKYLDHIEVPVLIDRVGGYSGVHNSVVVVANGRISRTEPIAHQWIEIPDGESSVTAVVSVGEWFLPGDTIIVSVLDASTSGILLYPSVTESLALDWLEDVYGDVTFPDGIASEYSEVRFVGTATFYDTIKNDAKTYVSHEKQTLTEAQKAQTCENIGMGKNDSVVFGSVSLRDNEELTVLLMALQFEDKPSILRIYDSYHDEDVVVDGVADPVNPNQAATKRYVDALSGNDPDIHAAYFTITDDGVVSLKPEYRGANDRADCPDASPRNELGELMLGVAGSKNAELPKHLIIPEIVDGVVVSTLANGIFRKNLAVVNVTIPNHITILPDRCFDGCNKLKTLYGTENIKTIGHCAFQSTSCVRLKFPSLERFASSMGGSCTSVFQKCGRMVYIDIGKVTVLPDKIFNECVRLNMVRSANGITTIGKNGFSLTASLKQLDVSKITSIGKAGFLCSGMDYNAWSELPDGATNGKDETAKVTNPVVFWSACTFTPCENPLPTFLSQNDERWASRQIGTTGVPYSDGCAFFSGMHAYCGLHNITLSTIEEFENIVNGIDTNLLNTFYPSPDVAKNFYRGLGLTVTEYTANQAGTQALYDALGEGKYALVYLGGASVSLNHMECVYGIDEKGELLLADSVARYKDDLSEAVKYSLPIENIMAQGTSIIIVSL